MRFSIYGLLIALLVIAGCESEFDPFQPADDINFSIYGFLDAAADTQFVAVTPLRDSIATRAAPIDAAVTLEELGTGRRTVWQDSLFTFSDGSVGHVFWSPEEITPGQAYEFTVQRSDGASSTVRVAIPDVVPTLELSTNFDPFSPILPRLQNIGVAGAEKMADFQVVYTLLLEGGEVVREFGISYLDQARQNEATGRFGLAFDSYSDVQARFPNNCPTALEAEVFVAAAGEEWPDFFRLDLETLARPDFALNVEQGLGFLGGVVTQRVEWPGLVSLFGLKQGQCLRGKR